MGYELGRQRALQKLGLAKIAGLARTRRLTKAMAKDPENMAIVEALGRNTLKFQRRVMGSGMPWQKYEKTRGFKEHLKTLQKEYGGG